MGSRDTHPAPNQEPARATLAFASAYGACHRWEAVYKLFDDPDQKELTPMAFYEKGVSAKKLPGIIKMQIIQDILLENGWERKRLPGKGRGWIYKRISPHFT